MNFNTVFPFRAASGFRPLRGLHIGHYGAVIKDIQTLQYAGKGCSFVFIADYHNRSQWSDKRDFVNTRRQSGEIARQLIASGVDPAYSVLYRQSDVPELFEFMWFLSGLASHTRLQSRHALKANPQPSAGVYLYPLLMVADILSLRSTTVIVGHDQKQHVELAREMARRLQKIFGENFVPIPQYHRPEPLLIHGVRTKPDEVPDPNGELARKMDVSAMNDIPLFEEEGTVRERIHQTVTRPVKWGSHLEVNNCNLIEYAGAIGGDVARAEFVNLYESGTCGYKEIKEKLYGLFMDVFSPMRDAYAQLSVEEAEGVLSEGGRRAREAINPLIMDVRRQIALSV